MPTVAQQIDQYLADADDWRGELLGSIRDMILACDKHVVEEFKYMGSPLWNCDGTICAGNTLKAKVKLTFAHGAQLDDPDKLFNNGFGGKEWRAIDLYEGDKLPKTAFKKLVKSAIAYNRALKKARATTAKS